MARGREALDEGNRFVMCGSQMALRSGKSEMDVGGPEF